MPRPDLSVVLLWHQHQPPYYDPATGTHIMPWVRLHAVKDYVDMVRTVLDAPPSVKVTFNLTPTLLDQVESLAADPSRDRWLALSRRPVRELSEGDVAFLVRELFSVHPDTMLAPWPRYRQLQEQSLSGAPLGRQDLLDLVVWFHLAWCGPTLREDPFVRSLFGKGRGFTGEDRDRLLDLQQAIVRDVIPIHRRALEAGRVELSTSAYYHPILPLLCRTEAATDAEPDVPLPGVRFRSPEDALLQIERALDQHAAWFGTRPAGMWPPEGAVSEEAVALMAKAGARWIATDEAVLSRSLGKSGPTDRVYSHGGLSIFFRDHELSDRIGFVYSRWTPDEAADDFVARLQRRRAHASCAAPVVTVALDGENAWEHFKGGGYDFLAALYRKLAEAPGIVMRTPSEVLESHKAEPLQRLGAGTWIDGSFRTWIGDPVKNLAWELLGNARREIAEAPEGTATDLARAAVLRAEASDWFWWFGEGHSTSHDAEFDLLFRRHVMAVYHALGLAAPARLERPLEDGARDPLRMEPTRLGRPPVTGEATPYYKWVSAGRVHLQQGSIHRFEPLVTCAFAMYDAEVLTLRLDTHRSAATLTSEGCVFELRVTSPVLRTIRISGSGAPEGAVQAAVGTCLEVALPLPEGGDVHLFWRVVNAGQELERFPWVGELVVPLRGAALDLENWAV